MANTKIICAACKCKIKEMDYNGAYSAAPVFIDVIFCGARHWDSIMDSQRQAYKDKNIYHFLSEEQGFIDQSGKFYTRKEAMDFCIANGQPLIHNPKYPKHKELYSEDLY